LSADIASLSLLLSLPGARVYFLHLIIRASIEGAIFLALAALACTHRRDRLMKKTKEAAGCSLVS
jgi:hypothetical protein